MPVTSRRNGLQNNPYGAPIWVAGKAPMSAKAKPRDFPPGYKQTKDEMFNLLKEGRHAQLTQSAS